MVYHGSLIHKPGKIPFRWPFRGWRYLATASGVIFLFWKTSLSETRRAGHAFSQWPWLRNRLRTEVPTICKAYFSGLCKGIYPKIWPKIWYSTTKMSPCYFLKTQDFSMALDSHGARFQGFPCSAGSLFPVVPCCSLLFPVVPCCSLLSLLSLLVVVVVLSLSL